jgi:hypothetical protein
VTSFRFYLYIFIKSLFNGRLEVLAAMVPSLWFLNWLILRP